MKTPPPILGDFIVPKAFTSKDADAWKRIGGWQRRGLVAVKPITKDSATVCLTDKGRQFIAN
jgi:hypothetical protein